MATLIFIPWPWNTPACYDAFIEALRSYGFTAATVILPTSGSDCATFDFVVERRILKKELTSISRTRRDVILVLHPRGKRRSISTKDLNDAKRAERSLKAGAARMIFFMAFMGAEGFVSTNISDDEVPQDFAEFELEVNSSNVFQPSNINVDHSEALSASVQSAQ